VRQLDAATGTKTVDLRPVGGLFLDRNGSLLFSVRSMVGRDVDIYGSDASLSAYLYPAVLTVRGMRSPGVWVQKLGAVACAWAWRRRSRARLAAPGCPRGRSTSAMNGAGCASDSKPPRLPRLTACLYIPSPFRTWPR